jgi:hypothetical protein
MDKVPGTVMLNGPPGAGGAGVWGTCIERLMLPIQAHGL